MTELIWDGKYKDGKKQGPVRIALPFQTIETVNESAQDRKRNLELFASGRDTEWRNRLIWGSRKTAGAICGPGPESPRFLRRKGIRPSSRPV